MVTIKLLKIITSKRCLEEKGKLDLHVWYELILLRCRIFLKNNNFK